MLRPERDEFRGGRVGARCGSDHDRTSGVFHPVIIFACVTLLVYDYYHQAGAGVSKGGAAAVGGPAAAGVGGV